MLQWMWADAQLLPGTHSWSERNPLRWSSLKDPLALAAKLDGEKQQTRSLQLRAANSTKATIFPNVSMAARWIRENYKAKQTNLQAMESPNFPAVADPALMAYRSQLDSARVDRPTLDAASAVGAHAHKSSVDKISQAAQATETQDPPSEEQDPRFEEWNLLLSKWSFLRGHAQKHDEVHRAMLCEYLQDAANWGIGWEALVGFEADVKQTFNARRPERTSMLDVVREIVVPQCRESGAPCALVRNNWEVHRVVGFVSHAWQGIFGEFMASLREVYDRFSTKPALFVSAFAVFQDQGFLRSVLEREIEDCPFLVALRAAEHFTVVRSKSVDVYLRSWCLLEHVYAKKQGLYPDRAHVSGPCAFALSKSSCRDAQTSAMGDRAKILRAILREWDAEAMDKLIVEFRHFGHKSPGWLEWLTSCLPCG